MIFELPGQHSQKKVSKHQLKALTPDNNQISHQLHGHHIKFTLSQPLDISSLLTDYQQTYLAQSLVFSYLSCQQAFYIRAQQLRHPLIFYYAHTMAMYINKFIEAGLLKERIDQHMETIMAIGVDQMSWDDDLDQHTHNWPTITQVRQYRSKVNLVILSVIQNLQNTVVQVESPVWDVLMSIQHHKIHIETSACIIRRVPISMIRQVPKLKQCPYRKTGIQQLPINDMISIKPYNFQWKYNKSNADMYLFDNQMGSASSKVESFQISKYQVSNGQFLQFVMDQGYEKEQYWTEEGKSWLKSKGRKFPIHWYVDTQSQRGYQGNTNRYKLKTMSKLVKMPWDWPVEVNHLEAKAFCQWKSIKQNKSYDLPTQEEFFAVRDQNIPNIYERQTIQGNFDRNHWFSPCPVDYFKHGQVYNIVGNLWQHTQTQFHSFRGFEVQKNFQDYSAPYFGSQHSMLFGGSFASGLKDALITRNWFRHHFYNFIGFRYVLSNNQTKIHNQQQQTIQYDPDILQSLHTHFIDKHSYVKKVMNLLIQKDFFMEGEMIAKALIVGTGVGGLVLHIAQRFTNVVAIDYSAKYFKLATTLLDKGQLHVNDVYKLTLDTLNITNSKNTHFMISNPQNPDLTKLNNFSFVLIDGKSLRRNSLSKVLKNACHFTNQQSTTRLLIIECLQKGNIIDQKVINDINFQLCYESNIQVDEIKLLCFKQF